MSAPIIWIFIPSMFAVFLYFIRSRRIIVNISGIILTGLLSIASLLLQIGEPISISNNFLQNQITIDPSLSILGRNFTISPNLTPVIFIIYAGISFWFIGALASENDTLFIPNGLLIAGLLVAAITVEPFLYAALIIELAVLVAIIILSPPGSTQIRGSMRFLSILTIGMVFILIAGLVLTGVETTPADTTFLLRVTAIVGIGFALLLGIFPFHSWIPIVSEETYPYSAAFVLYVIPQAVLLFLLNFLSRLDWLSSNFTVYITLRIMGIVMVIFGGIWAGFQNHLGRIFGFVVMMEIGFSVLSLSLLNPSEFVVEPSILEKVNFNQQGLLIFFSLFFPRLLAFGLWSLGMVVLKRDYKDLSLEKIAGCVFSHPYASLSILIAMFSLVGLPFLAGFPTRLALLTTMIQQSGLTAMLIVLGTFGLFIGAARALFYFTKKENITLPSIKESSNQKILFVAGCLLLFLGGIFPKLFLMINLEIPLVF